MGINASRAADFINSIGVGVHLNDNAGPYGNLNLVASELNFLGVHNIRAANAVAWSIGNYEILAANGYKMDLVVTHDPGENITSASIQQDLSLIAQIVQMVPGSIIALEGQNEPNYSPDYLSGVLINDWTTVYQAQSLIYSAVRSNPTLNGIPLLNASIDTWTFAGAFPTMASISDGSNAHVYPWGGEQPIHLLDVILAEQQQIVPTKPVWITEFGYSTTPGDQVYGTDNATQAKNILDGLLDAYREGVSKTFLYQLMDEALNISPDDAWGALGLFNADGSPKLVATAIHNMNTILADSGSGAAVFQTGSLNYAITGLPSNGYSLLLEKSDGTYDLALWNEVEDYDPTTESDVYNPPVTVTITTPSPYAALEVYDPLVGTAPIETFTSINSLQVNLTDHPIFLHIALSASQVAATPRPVVPGTASLAVAETSGPTTIGISQPTDPNFSSAQLTIYLVSLPTNGTVTLANGGMVWQWATLTSAQLAGLRFTPTPGVYNQTSSLIYLVKDPNGNQSNGSVTLAIGPQLDPVVPAAATLIVAETSGPTAIGIAQPTDPSFGSDQLTTYLVSLPTNGTVTLANGGMVWQWATLTSAQLAGLRFTPTPGLYNQTSSLTYLVKDPSGNQTTGSVTLAIGPQGSPVVAATAPLVVAETSGPTAIGIAQSTDPSFGSDQLTTYLTSLPTNGTVTLANGGPVWQWATLTSAQLAGLRFTPTPGVYNQTSSLTYLVKDPSGNQTTGSVTLAIGPQGPPVVAATAPLVVAEMSGPNAIGIAQPTDPSFGSDQLTTYLTSLPTNGTVTLANGGIVWQWATLTSAQLAGLRFTPTPGVHNQVSSLTYLVKDPSGNQTTGSVTLAVGPQGPPVVPATAPLIVAETAGPTAIGISQPTDPIFSSAQLTNYLVSLPTNGTLTLANGGIVWQWIALTSAQLAGLRFTPTPGVYNQTSSLTYLVKDPSGNQTTGSVTLAIGPQGPPVVPATAPLTVAATAGPTAIGISPPTDPSFSSDQLTNYLVSLPTDGTLTLANGGIVWQWDALTSAQLTGLRFAPTTGLSNQTSSLTYLVKDPSGYQTTGSVTLNVGASTLASILPSP